MPRNDLTPADKVKLLDKIRELPNASVRTLAEVLNVPRATIGRLQRMEAEIRLQASLTAKKRKRDGKNPHIEKALLQWFRVFSGRGLPVTGPLLLQTAQELALKFGYTDFKATEGWLGRWKKRHNVQLKKLKEEKAAADEWKTTILPDILDKFSPDDIYSADETGLFYRAAPDGALCFRKDELDLATVTILCCANMTGRDKRKLVMITKSDTAWDTTLCQTKLPVEFVATPTGWITPQIFAEWLVNWDNRLQEESRFIALVVDDCPPHPRVDYLQNITLVFLPPSLASPLALGVTRNFKDRYKSKIVELIVEKRLDHRSTGEEIGASIDLDLAMNLLADSWRAVTPRTIETYFSQSGFTLNGKELKDEETVPSALTAVKNGDEFRNLDNEFKCYEEGEECGAEKEDSRTGESEGEDSRMGENEGEDSQMGENEGEDSRMGEIKREYSQMGESEREDSQIGEIEREDCPIGEIKTEDNLIDEIKRESSMGESERGEGSQLGANVDQHELSPVSVEEAAACIELLRRFFTQKGNEDSPMSALQTCQAYVALASAGAEHFL